MTEEKNPTTAPSQVRTVKQPAAGASRYEQYATTQADGDGVEGDVLKKDKSPDEKLGAQMTDHK